MRFSAQRRPRIGAREGDRVRSLFDPPTGGGRRKRRVRLVSRGQEDGVANPGRPGVN